MGLFNSVSLFGKLSSAASPSNFECFCATVAGTSVCPLHYQVLLGCVSRPRHHPVKKLTQPYPVVFQICLVYMKANISSSSSSDENVPSFKDRRVLGDFYKHNDFREGMARYIRCTWEEPQVAPVRLLSGGHGGIMGQGN